MQRRGREGWGWFLCLLDLGSGKDKDELSFVTLSNPKGLFIFLALFILEFIYFLNWDQETLWILPVSDNLILKHHLKKYKNNDFHVWHLFL